MKWLVAVSLAMLVIGAAACTSSQAGTPVPTRSVTEETPTSEDSSQPARPQELPLEGIDPCSLVTEQQRAGFAIDRPPLPGKQPEGGPLKDSPTCNYRSSTAEYSFLIISSTTVGLSEYLDQIGENPTRRSLVVDGFPASQDQLQMEADPGNDACFVDVDVADGQLLEVQFGQVASNKPLPMETLCAKAVEVAEAALTTLQGQR
jgi:hypothetical protein